MSKTTNRRCTVQMGQTLVLMLMAAGMACASTQQGGEGMRAAPSKFGNGSSTTNYVSHLDYSGTSYYASYPCTGCTDPVILEFQPVEDTYKFQWEPAVHAVNKGSVVARVINRSDVTFRDDKFTLEPYETSQQSAYAWVGYAIQSNGNDWRGFGVYTLDGSGKVNGEWSLVEPSKINVCTTATPPSKSAIHKMPPASTGCHYLSQKGASMVTRLASRAIPSDYPAASRSTAALGIGGLWISCSGGCCQVSTM